MPTFNEKNIKEALANNRLSNLPVDENLIKKLKAADNDSGITIDELIKLFVEQTNFSE